jgi:hypothetical protein
MSWPLQLSRYFSSKPDEPTIPERNSSHINFEVLEGAKPEIRTVHVDLSRASSLKQSPLLERAGTFHLDLYRVSSLKYRPRQLTKLPVKVLENNIQINLFTDMLKSKDDEVLELQNKLEEVMAYNQHLNLTIRRILNINDAIKTELNDNRKENGSETLSLLYQETNPIMDNDTVSLQPVGFYTDSIDDGRSARTM